jgi:murein L,D-transpeptidase YafK
MRPSSDLYARTHPPSTARIRALVLGFGVFAATFAARAVAETNAAPPAAATESATSPAQGESGDRGHTVDAARPETAPSTSPSHEAATELWRGVQVVVYKSKRLLSVYRDGVFQKEYRVVLGLVPDGRKRHASDARTPEGLYRVAGKRRHERWQHFLALDYPNAKDRAQYDSEVRRGAIPDDGGKPFGIGGDIGIHGNDRVAEQTAGIDWTKGCIAMSAADIQEINETVPVGAPVWIVQ